MSITFSLLVGLDYAISTVLGTTDDTVPVALFWASCILFYGLSLKSLALYFLDNTQSILIKAVALS